MSNIHEFPGARHADDIPMLDTVDGKRIHFAQWFGYPPCCHNAFWFDRDWLYGKESDDEVRIGMIGTGYRPCPECQKKTTQELYDYICANRFSDVPFPLQEQDFQADGKLQLVYFLGTSEFIMKWKAAGVKIQQSLLDLMETQQRLYRESIEDDAD